MQIPSADQIHTAIEVLQKCGEHISHNAEDLVVQLPESHFGEHCAARVEVLNIEQVTRIQTLISQLEERRDELLQQNGHRVFSFLREHKPYSLVG